MAKTTSLSLPWDTPTPPGEAERLRRAAIAQADADYARIQARKAAEEARGRDFPAAPPVARFDPSDDEVTREQKRIYWRWSDMAHKHHSLSASDDTCLIEHHPLCPICNPHVLEEEPWHAMETCEAATGTSARTATAPAATTMVISAGPAEAPAGKAAATPSSWAYEPRQAWLARTLERSPGMADRLVSWGLWTGEYDDAGAPIPSDRALHCGLSEYLADRMDANPHAEESIAYAGLNDRGDSLWRFLCVPVYDSGDPEWRKMRSLRDTLLLDPTAGPHMIAAGLWSGQYDAAEFPIPTRAKTA